MFRFFRPVIKEIPKNPFTSRQLSRKPRERIPFSRKADDPLSFADKGALFLSFVVTPILYLGLHLRSQFKIKSGKWPKDY